MDPRRRELARIHCLTRDLGIDRDTYQAMLANVMHVDSAAKLDSRGRRRLIALLRGKSAAPSHAHRDDAPNTLDQRPMLRKIEALLADAGRPWTYAEALARRIGHRDRLEFCSDGDLGKIIAALSYDQLRRRRHAGGSHDGR